MAYREDVVGDIARRLGAEQARVRAALATLDGMDDGRWLRGLDGRARERLLVQGHFPEYGSELEWNAREVVGHLRDSARIFTARIRALQTTSEPVLADFVTDDPARLADYRTRTLPICSQSWPMPKELCIG